MESYEKYFEANKLLWNQRTKIHKDSAFYNRKGFLAGDDVLTPIELTALGSVAGKSMLHLQCHFGLDSLNWQRLGARVTGVDLSDEAIREAQQLNVALQMEANFICCNVYDLKKHLDKKFDIVFTSYGTIGWLPDLDKWADIIAHFVKDDGVFFMADFHPVVWMFDDDFTKIQYAYNNREVIKTDKSGTYTDPNAAIHLAEYGWNHSISEILNALIQHGLHIENFNEFMYAPYSCFAHSIEVEKNKWQIKGLENKIPMVYSLLARKQ
ncbi:MAG: class I SAM-dependent methyltransferase [Chitinophagaceae bacterium]